MSTDHDLEGLSRPYESSFSGIMDTTLSTVNTMDDAATNYVKPSASSAAVAEVGENLMSSKFRVSWSENLLSFLATDEGVEHV